MCDQYADWEGAYLASQFNQAADWQVIPVVNSIGVFQTKVNTILPDIPLDANVLILIGGNSWQHDYPSLTKLISQYLLQERVVGAICGSVDDLARNGLLTGYQHTGNAQFLWQDDKQYINPTYFKDKQAVRDRNLITANGTAALDFTGEVLSAVAINQKKAHQEIELQRIGFCQYTKQYGNPYQ